MTPEALTEFETMLCGLLKGEFSHLILSFNDSSGSNYQTVAQELERGDDYNACGWISEEERQKAIDTNSHWTLHWYPNTPVGFYVLHASSLPALIEGLKDFDQ